MFAKITLCLFLSGVLAISAYPVVEEVKSELVEFTTVRSANDDITTVVADADDAQSDDVTTSAPIIVVREDVLIPEEVKPLVEEVVPAVTDLPVVEEKKVEPVVVAEVIGSKVVPVVEIVEVKAAQVPFVKDVQPAANKV